MDDNSAVRGIMKRSVMIYPVDTCVAVAYWTILPPLSPDKDSVPKFWVMKKINEIDKYQ